MSAAFRLIDSPVRREILRLVWKEERGAGEIARHFRTLTFGAVSQHLAKLLAAGVLERRREGKRLFYQAQPKRLGPVAAMLEVFWSDALGRLKDLAETEQRATSRKKRADSPRDTSPADSRRHTKRVRHTRKTDSRKAASRQVALRKANARKAAAKRKQK